MTDTIDGESIVGRIVNPLMDRIVEVPLIFEGDLGIQIHLDHAAYDAMLVRPT